ncbi:hypothetical protein FOXYSP1_04974 [Fusarium oxysporum f. sp. phaseoli]
MVRADNAPELLLTMTEAGEEHSRSSELSRFFMWSVLPITSDIIRAAIWRMRS